MTEKEFNLLDEPWILAINHKGEMEELSLIDVFRRAHELQGLAGELPTQDIAILRILLAILHATFGRLDTKGNAAPISAQSEAQPTDALARWKDLWGRGQFPCSIIESYLSKYHDRFWLFHPERPFFQVAALANTPTTSYGVSKLNGELSESTNKIRLFQQRTGASKAALKYNEATRWLIYINAFDDTSAKPKGKDMPSPGVGWLGKLGLVIAIGNNLFETLMLNFVLLQNGEDKLWDNEKPVWELEQVKLDERTPITMPTNASQLLTLQSRRLLLVRDGESVIGYGLLGGDFFPKENSFAEHMTIWRNAAKKEGAVPEFVPRRHDPSRKLWRDFASLSAQGVGNNRPGIIKWLGRLKHEGIIHHSHFIFHTAATHYGDKDFFVDDAFSDSLSFNSGLLSDLGAKWVYRIINEIETTSQLVRQLWFLARNLAIADGGSNENDRGNTAKEQAYYQLDAPFRQWLDGIDPEEEMDDACLEWFTIARRIIRSIGKELLNQCGPQAYIGREVKIKDKTHLYTAPDLFNQFLSQTKDRAALERSGKKEVKR